MKSISRFLFLAAALLAANFVGAAERPAKEVLDEALASAKRENKEVFLVFGGTGCAWCKVLDRFLEWPEVKPIFAKYFVVAHLQLGDDVTSNPGAADIHSRYKADGGVPYHLFLKSDGTLIVDSKE